MSSVLDFGAKGDGKSDDTSAIQHAIEKGDGQVLLPRGTYLITRPLRVPLDRFGAMSISGHGGTARLLMSGTGPALHLAGTHRKSALPANFAEGVWQHERMPTLRDLEITGMDAKADGVRIEGTMQATLHNLLVRRCRHAVVLTNRNRNVLISDCHFYDNRGVGVFLDQINLHQINIHGSHISYCKQGGIRIAGSEIRNIQICGNDIEYNYDTDAETSADILFDCREGTIREGTIVGNTIQAKASPGGANIHLVGAGKDNPNAVGMLSISGNLIGDQQTLVHLQAARGVTISGNCLYNGVHYSIRAEDCEHLVFGPNAIDHNPDYKGKSTDAVLFERCRNVTVSGLTMQHTHEPERETAASLIVDDCRNVSITGSQIFGAGVAGVAIRRSSVVRIADCTIRGREGDNAYRRAVTSDAKSSPLQVVNNFLGRGSEGTFHPQQKGQIESGNIAIE